jgi:hypothetical protein
MALFCLVLLRLSWWTAGYFSRAEGFWHGEDRVLIFLIHGLPLTIALIFLEYYTGSYWPDE